MPIAITFNGDPTILGWTTTVIYLIAAVLSFRSAREIRVAEPSFSRIWLVLGIGMLLLGINKEMDLQTTLIQTGRSLAKALGIYERRLLLHWAFFVTVMAAALILGIRFFSLLRQFASRYRRSTIGLALILLYVVMRAVSIQHVDVATGLHFESRRFGWVAEVAGVCLLISNTALATSDCNARRKKGV